MKAISQFVVIAMLAAAGYAIYHRGPAAGTDIGQFFRNILDSYNAAAMSPPRSQSSASARRL